MSVHYEPKWETVENGWHAVASLLNNGYQWTAYVQYVNAPYWRVWAGCLFENLQEAQAWCRAEIANQMQQAPSLPAEPGTEHGYSWDQEPEAWRWLWNTLSKEIGITKTEEIRNELARRLREHPHSQPIKPCKENP